MFCWTFIRSPHRRWRLKLGIAPAQNSTPDEGRPEWCGHVRFGSKADIGACPRHVRLTLKADMDWHSCDVRFVPKSDSCSAANGSLFDHLVGVSSREAGSSRHFSAP